MSDVYDSLDEETDCDFSLDSLDSIREIPKCDQTDRLIKSEKLKGEGKNRVWANKRKENVLPKIENSFRGEGCKTDAVRVVKDNEVLSERELQSKKDGSATKSPKMELEELPFVTREYRNLQFQKRKMYALSDGKKRTKKKKNVVSLKKNAENKSVEAAKKGLLSNKNFSYLKHASSKKLMNNNLTDAMKEKLLQKHNENSPRKITLNQVRKSKVLEGNCSASAKNNPEKNVKISIKKSATKLPTISQKDKTIEKVQKIEKKPATNSFKSKSHIFDILKNRSDISLNRFNTRLSYLERHQKESGFNPLSLRCNFQKCLSDTNRSNFGDSAVGDLPEISSQILSVDRASIDTDEELFYLELIENDKRKRLAQRSSRSEAQLDTRRTIDFSATNSCKDGKVLKCIRKSISSYKNNKKFTAIDIPNEFKEFACPLKKSCHYCSLNSSSSMSKADLALKARAYGLMVNARNVFKLKNQSAVRSNEIDSASQFDKPSEKSNSLLKIRCGGADVKSHNETSAVFKSKKMNKFEYTKTDELKSEREHNRALAEYDKEPVRRKPTRKEGDFTAEILQRMRYCLDQDITYQNLNKTNVIETCSEQVLQR